MGLSVKTKFFNLNSCAGDIRGFLPVFTLSFEPYRPFSLNLFAQIRIWLWLKRDKSADFLLLILTKGRAVVASGLLFILTGLCYNGQFALNEVFKEFMYYWCNKEPLFYIKMITFYSPKKQKDHFLHSDRCNKAIIN